MNNEQLIVIQRCLRLFQVESLQKLLKSCSLLLLITLTHYSYSLLLLIIMSIPILIANILALLAFALHTFVGDKELKVNEPLREVTRIL
jgi:hypothetical protein